MINFLMGPPGAGKSYEAVVYHVLPALQNGRKVITNLPLNLEAFGALDPSFLSLIEIRTIPAPVLGTFEAGSDGEAFKLGKRPPQDAARRPFSGPWCFYSTWRHPESGIGPLFVVDECHLAFPRGATDRAVEEWFSIHRHFKVDVLLMSQGYRKVSASITELVQVAYRCRKNIALGSDGTYVRKVQDGLRGEVVNTSIRKYQSKFFGLYKSHTQSSGIGSEAQANDIRPIWKNWTFLGAAGCFLSVAALAASGNVPNPLKPDALKGPSATAKVEPPPGVPAAFTPQPAQAADSQASAPTVDHPVLPSTAEPFAGKGLHLTGHAEFGSRQMWTFVLSQNGQHVSTLTDADLRAAGYTWQGTSPCHGVATHQDVVRVVVCDSPQVGFEGTAIQPKEGPR